MKLPVLCLMVVLCAFTQTARAETAQRLRGLNTAGACQSALPVYDGNIRKRPKAVQNEGTKSAFVTCSFTSDHPPATVYMYATSQDGQPHTLSCQAIPGYDGQSIAAVVKTESIPGDGGQATFAWTGDDWSEGEAELPSRLFSTSCLLEPGVGLNDVRILFREEVGA